MEILKRGLAEWNITLSKEQTEQFEDYYRLLIEWNKKINLTAITDYDEVQKKHFLDSISIIKTADVSAAENLIDIGTGAGFPGIPLKILYPSLLITLADSLNKRIVFLNDVIEKLNLKHVKTVHARAEELARKKEYREAYDICVSRAVAGLSVLSEYCLPFVRVKGCFISYKAGNIQEEMSEAEKAIQILGGKPEKKFSLTLPETDYGRTLVLIRKVKHTPKKYPRKAGIPSREPLK